MYPNKVGFPIKKMLIAAFLVFGGIFIMSMASNSLWNSTKNMSEEVQTTQKKYAQYKNWTGVFRDAPQDCQTKMAASIDLQKSSGSGIFDYFRNLEVKKKNKEAYASVMACSQIAEGIKSVEKAEVLVETNRRLQERYAQIQLKVNALSTKEEYKRMVLEPESFEAYQKKYGDFERYIGDKNQVERQELDRYVTSLNSQIGVLGNKTAEIEKTYAFLLENQGNPAKYLAEVKQNNEAALGAYNDARNNLSSNENRQSSEHLQRSNYYYGQSQNSFGTGDMIAVLLLARMSSNFSHRTDNIVFPKTSNGYRSRYNSSYSSSSPVRSKYYSSSSNRSDSRSWGSSGNSSSSSGYNSGSSSNKSSSSGYNSGGKSSSSGYKSSGSSRRSDSRSWGSGSRRSSRRR